MVGVGFEGHEAAARVRRAAVIKARQELRRDERAAVPEDTGSDLCDRDIQRAHRAYRPHRRRTPDHGKEREREFTRNRASSSPTGPPPPSPTPFYDYAVRSRDPFLLFLLFWIVSSMFMENEKKIRGREEKIARGEHNA